MLREKKKKVIGRRAIIISSMVFPKKKRHRHRLGLAGGAIISRMVWLRVWQAGGLIIISGMVFSKKKKRSWARVGCLAGWLADWLAGWLSGWLDLWLALWLALPVAGYLVLVGESVRILNIRSSGRAGGAILGKYYFLNQH